jgi:dihydrofolate reductase
MRKLIESTYLSLDGMMSGDAFWAPQMAIPRNDRHNELAFELLDGCEGLVLGRATYESFLGVWPNLTGDVADKINALPKYVASTTMTELSWNAEILAGDAVKAIGELKEDGDGTLMKYGSGPLSSALHEAGLLDELHLWVSPYVAGSGEPLLPGIAADFDLTGVTELGTGIVVLSYAIKR